MVIIKHTIIGSISWQNMKIIRRWFSDMFKELSDRNERTMEEFNSINDIHYGKAHSDQQIK